MLFFACLFWLSVILAIGSVILYAYEVYQDIQEAKAIRLRNQQERD